MKNIKITFEDYLNYLEMSTISIFTDIENLYAFKEDYILDSNYSIFEKTTKISILVFLSFLILMLISIAYYTLCDRKIMAAMQRRMGPNVVGVWGLLQPFADGLKLFIKEIVVPNKSNKILFFLAPIISFGVSLMGWIVMPFPTIGRGFADVYLTVLYTLGISSLGVYGTLLAGWSSNSKYAFLGALRSVAQTVSYEVSLSLLVFCVCLLSKSLNYTDIIQYQSEAGYNLLPLFPIFIMFLITMLAETNRIPFDLPEAEAELVAGYNIEYSGLSFALFFLAEYSNMLIITTFLIILFLGGYLPIIPISFYIFSSDFLSIFSSFIYNNILVKFNNIIPSLSILEYLPTIRFGFEILSSIFSIIILILLSCIIFIKKLLILINVISLNEFYFMSIFIKISFFIFFFVWVRATFPRYRYDQLMKLGWKVHLPIALSISLFIITLIYIIL